jgi:hypothetical protein
MEGPINHNIRWYRGIEGLDTASRSSQYTPHRLVFERKGQRQRTYTKRRGVSRWARLEVLRAVLVNISVYWNMTPCGLAYTHQHFSLLLTYWKFVLCSFYCLPYDRPTVSLFILLSALRQAHSLFVHFIVSLTTGPQPLCSFYCLPYDRPTVSSITSSPESAI